MSNDKEEASIIESTQTSLLESARAATCLSDAEIQQILRNEFALFQDTYRNFASHDAFGRLLRKNIASMIYRYCSELRRRRTGKHSYDMLSPIMRGQDVWKSVALSDIVPHVVEVD